MVDPPQDRSRRRSGAHHRWRRRRCHLKPSRREDASRCGCHSASSCRLRRRIHRGRERRRERAGLPTRRRLISREPSTFAANAKDRHSAAEKKDSRVLEEDGWMKRNGLLHQQGQRKANKPTSKNKTTTALRRRAANPAGSMSWSKRRRDRL